jgi:hypothetical protein
VRGGYAVGPHYGWSMTGSTGQVRGAGARALGDGSRREVQLAAAYAWEYTFVAQLLWLRQYFACLCSLTTIVNPFSTIVNPLQPHTHTSLED